MYFGTVVKWMKTLLNFNIILCISQVKTSADYDASYIKRKCLAGIS